MQAYHRIDDCKAVFVTWIWMIGILVSLVGFVGGGAYMYAGAESVQDQKIEKLCDDVDKIGKVHDDLDTIKTLLRVR